ncbi:MAG: hypothetical protein GPW18_05465 [Euryarchaeota archaeon]|nr:hypothetical protein [Euryarchaeota archaeon]
MIIIKPENLLYYIPQIIFGAIVAYISYKIFIKYKMRLEETNSALKKYQEYILEKKRNYENLHHLSIKIQGINPSAMGIDSEKIVNVAISKKYEIPDPDRITVLLKEREDFNYVTSHIIIYMIISIWIGLMILFSPFNLAVIFLPQFSPLLNEILILLIASLIYASIMSFVYFLYGRTKETLWNFQAVLSVLLILSMFFPSISFLWWPNLIRFAQIYITVLLLFTFIHIGILLMRKKSNLLTLSYLTIFSSNLLFDIILIINIINFIRIHG